MDRTPDPRVLALLKRYGRNATSFQLLERDFLYWFDDQADACVAYVDTGGAWVAGGEPIAAPEAVVAVAERFLSAAAAAGRRAAFFATEGQLADSLQLERLLLGEQPVWDPREWDTTVSATRSLRSQLRRAAAKGVTVREVTAGDVGATAGRVADAEGASAPETPPPLREALEALITRWRATRAMSAMGFLVRLEPFLAAHERRLFVAERVRRPESDSKVDTEGDTDGDTEGGAEGDTEVDTEGEADGAGEPVALLSMAPVYARGGWLFEDLLRAPDAPNGTSELLVDAGMRAVAETGSGWATLGLAPLAGDVPRWLQWVRTAATPFFNFRGLATFKAKLRPARWEPVWLAWPRGASGARALLDALTAFAGGSVLRFVWRTVLRGPRPVLWAMAVLLVPWTLVLASLDPVRWYPAAWMRPAWVAFDALLCVLLFALAWRWRSWLARVAAILVTADVAMSVAQATTWYAPRVADWRDVLAVLVAVSAPLLASVVLWGAVRRDHVMRTR